MIQKIYKFIQQNKLIEEGDTILVGVSGGADSVCLLCVLSELYRNTDVTLRAVHINHQLRESALRDQKYTEDLCEKLQIPLKIVLMDVAIYAKEHHLSTEEAARLLRYEAFYQAVEDVPEDKRKIAVAHNMNDNAETVLFNLFRGSGLRGLGGIPKVRGEIIRPLLCVTRNEIENFLKERNIEFCVDETNLTDDYSRNRIRHHILPAAEEMVNKGAVKRVNETARGLLAAEDFIFGEIKKAEREYIKINTNLRLNSKSEKEELQIKCSESLNAENEKEKHQSKYSNGYTAEVGKEELYRDTSEILISERAKEELHSYLLERLILEELAVVCGTAKDISAIHVSQVTDMFSMQVGKQISLPYGCVACRVYQGILLCKKSSRDVTDIIKTETYLEKSELEKLSQAVIQLPIQKERHDDSRFLSHFTCRIFSFDGDLKKIPYDKYTKWFDYDKIKDNVCFRTRKSGDYLIIDDNNSRKTLKAYFINEKVPREKRDKIIVAADGSHILWAVGYRTSTGCNVSDKTKTILEIKYEE